MIEKSPSQILGNFISSLTFILIQGPFAEFFEDFSYLFMLISIFFFFLRKHIFIFIHGTSLYEDAILYFLYTGKVQSIKSAF